MTGTQGRAESFRCPTCTADMTFDPNSQALACAHCGTNVAVGNQEGQQAIVAYDLRQGVARAAACGLGAPMRSIKCQECYATVSFPDAVTSMTCEFCGSNQVLPQEANQQLIRPESVVPFKVDGKGAADLFRRWLGGLWFRPSNLQKQARVNEMKGVYIPYWSFDALVDSSWTAEAGHYYYVTETYMDRDEKGNTVQKTRQVRKTRWEPAWGSRRDAYQDHLVTASRGVPEELAQRLSTFDTSQLQPYHPGFLAGWRAEEYAVEINDAWAKAVQSMESSQRSNCADDIPGDTHRGLNVTNRYHDEKFKHILLPVWIAAFRYSGKPYRFLVNGQTGEVVGKAPWSVVKIVAFILFLLLILGAIVALAGIFSMMSEGGSYGGYLEPPPIMDRHDGDQRRTDLVRDLDLSSASEAFAFSRMSGLSVSTITRPDCPAEATCPSSFAPRARAGDIRAEIHRAKPTFHPRHRRIRA